jgi:hypothetical protein
MISHPERSEGSLSPSIELDLTQSYIEYLISVIRVDQW